MSQVNKIRIKSLILVNNSTGLSVDLTNILMKLNIYEDLFINYTTASISLADGMGLLEKLPLTGNEQVLISFTGSEVLDDMKEYIKAFDVFSIAEVSQEKGKRLRFYTLHLVTPLATLSRQKKLRLGVEGTESDIVKDIFNLNIFDGIEPAPLLEVEESKDKNTHIFPNWTPLEAINSLAQKAQSNGDLESASYLFFEDRDKYNFKSIEFLFKQPTEVTFNQELPKSIGDVNFFSFKTLDIENVFNNIVQSTAGGFGSTTYDVDTINKTVTTKENTFEELFGRVQKIEATAKPLKDQALESTKRKTFNTYSTDYVEATFDKKATRAFVLASLENFKLIGTTNGNSGLELGSIAELDLTSQNRITDSDKDLIMSGRYLITNIRHEVTTSDYVNTIEFRKPTQRGI